MTNSCQTSFDSEETLLKVLLVDDSSSVLNNLYEMLTNKGHEVLTAEDGVKGFQRYRENPDLSVIISDIDMPRMSGLELLKQIRCENREIPIIMLTSISATDTIIKAIKEGANHFVLKSSDFKTSLFQALDEVMEKYFLKRSLREKELQLVETDRLVGLYTLAAGVCHEINNPLGFVKSSLNSMKKNMDKMTYAVNFWNNANIPDQTKREYKEYLKDLKLDFFFDTLDNRYNRMLRGIRRIEDIVNNLKSFSCIDIAAIDNIDINQSIKDTIQLLSNNINDKIRFTTTFGQIPVMQDFDRNKINQCLFQLIKNAIDAVGDNGAIEVITFYSETDELISVKVIDNGAGMSDTVLRQAYNPFFTTKQVGDGIGIGLTIAKKIIDDMHGNLYIDSVEGKGTTIEMTLPFKIVNIR